jgi:hypothetical protein
MPKILVRQKTSRGEIEDALSPSVVSSSRLAQYTSPIAPRLMSKLALAQSSANVVMLGDSTMTDGQMEDVAPGATVSAWLKTVFPRTFVPPAHSNQNGYFHQLALWFAAQFPAYTVRITNWVGEGFGGKFEAFTTLQVGTGEGPPVLSFYNSGIVGTQEQYALIRIPAMIGAVAPDLVFMGYGHNISAEVARFGWRMKSLAHAVLAAAPLTEIAMIAQNAQTANTNQQKRVFEVHRVARQVGGAFVNFCQAIIDASPEWMTELINADGVHPNSSGNAVELNVLVAGLTAGAYAQPSAPVESGFNRAAGNLLANGDFSAYTGGAVLPGWTLAHCTPSKDEVNYENPRKYAVKLTSDGGGVFAKISQVLIASALDGRYVTMAVRMRVPSGQADDVNIGSISLADNISGTESTLVSINCRDGLYWEVISKRINATAGNMTASINVDSANAAAAEITVDRAILVVGDVPYDTTPGTLPDFIAGFTAEGESSWTGTIGTTFVISTKIPGDSKARHIVDSNGTHYWGAGGAESTDTKIERSGAATLKVSSGMLWVFQSLIRATSAVKIAEYQLTKTDEVIPVDTTAGAFTIKLPASSGLIVGKTYEIVDSTGQCAAKNLTLSIFGGSGDLINGAATNVLSTAWGSLKVKLVAAKVWVVS